MYLVLHYLYMCNGDIIPHLLSCSLRQATPNTPSDAKKTTLTRVVANCASWLCFPSVQCPPPLSRFGMAYA